MNPKKLIKLHKNKLINPENRLQNSKKYKYISKAKGAKLALEVDNTQRLQWNSLNLKR